MSIMTHFLGTPFPLSGLYSCEYWCIICWRLDHRLVCGEQACFNGLPRFIASTRPKAMAFKANFHIIISDWPLEVSVKAVHDDNGRSTIAAQLCV